MINLINYFLFSLKKCWVWFWKIFSNYFQKDFEITNILIEIKERNNQFDKNFNSYSRSKWKINSKIWGIFEFSIHWEIFSLLKKTKNRRNEKISTFLNHFRELCSIFGFLNSFVKWLLKSKITKIQFSSISKNP